MNCRRIVISLVCLVSAVILTFAQAHAEPVLIKLTLEEENDWTNAKLLGVVAFQRFDSFVLAEFEKAKLEELDRVGLEYQIIDENPWSEEYFLVFPVEEIAKVNLGLYGRILLEDPKWQLIKTSRQKAFELRPLGYKVTPILHEPIPLEFKLPLKVTKGALKYSADIDSLVNLVSKDSLYAWDLRLQNFKTRYSYSDSIYRARDWLFNKFVSFGIDSIWLHHYYWDSHQYNVVATVVGTAQPDKVIVVGGHYDSVVYGNGDPFTWAPGADDNASGTVATLEMARIIAQNPLPVTVMFVPFAQEEQGLIGSYFLAGYLYYNNVDVELMINSDMIGHSVDIDTDAVIFAASGARDYVNIMMDMAHAYTFLHPYYGGQTSGSDHYPFYQQGYDAVYAQEGDFHYAGWHTNYDVVDSLDFTYMREVVKMCLATLALVGNSPSPVENLKAVDAGDGDRIYLSWSPNHPAENINHYNVYFGTKSGDYDSLHQVAVACDTLCNLGPDTTYFMTVTAVNANGFESLLKHEVSVAPRVVPLPPKGLSATPSGSFKIKLTWHPNQEADFDYYNIYRSEESGTGYQLLLGACRETTFVDSTVQGDVEYYYYTLTAVDTSGNESQMSAEVKSFVVSLNQGILLVDETYINKFYNMVDGDSTNAFYNRALWGYTYAYTDHSYPTGSPQNQVSLRELGRYSVVIIHSEDQKEIYSLGAEYDSTYLVLKEYLNFGGKAIIEGRRNLSSGYSFDCGLRKFLPGNIPYDYLKVKSAYVPCWSSSVRTEEFIGAESQISGYPDLQVDSLRVAQCGSGLELAGRVPGVGYIDSLRAGEVIYTFHSDYDTSSFEGKPVGFRYLGDDYKVIYFDFPLYFIRESQAAGLLHKALGDLGISPYICGDCNHDFLVNGGDVVYLINYLFAGGPPLHTMAAGDVNVDGEVDVADVLYLINYLFAHGSPPCQPTPEGLAKKPGSAEVRLRTSQINDRQVSIFLDAEFDHQVSGVQLELEWNQEKLELSNIQQTIRTQKLGLYHNNGREGKLEAGILDISRRESISAGKGPLLELIMRSKTEGPDLSSIEIKKAILVDVNGQKLAVHIAKRLDSSNLPERFSLAQNYPNPFNPQTVIQYALPHAGEVQITIYNILGEKVRTLVDAYQNVGYKRVEWDGNDDRGEEVASGIYFYRLQTQDFTQTKKMVMIR